MRCSVRDAGMAYCDAKKRRFVRFIGRLRGQAAVVRHIARLVILTNGQTVALLAAWPDLGPQLNRSWSSSSPIFSSNRLARKPALLENRFAPNIGRLHHAPQPFAQVR